MHEQGGPTNPLVASAGRLQAMDPQVCRLQVDGPGERAAGETWLDLADPEGGLDLLVAAGERLGRRPDHLGASIASAVVDAVLSAHLPPLLVDRCLPGPGAGLQARLHPDELWFDAVESGGGSCCLVAGDPRAQEPGVEVVEGVDALHRALAGALLETGRTWFPAVRRRAPFGRRGMWGQLADDVHATALWTARVAGLDPRTTWDEAQTIVGLVAAEAPELKVRPRPFPVTWSGGEALWQVKGTCCLWYTACPELERDASYCTSCPLRPDDLRHELLRSWMESQAALTADP
jgi:hypothetical protein